MWLAPQAQKFLGSELETAIRESSDPAEARELAKEHEEKVRDDWSEMKEKVMLAGLIAKFSQNAALRDELLATKYAFLVEHSKKDAYWGDGHADGLNRLGVLLMEVRKLMRKSLGLAEENEEEKRKEDASRAKTELSMAELKKMLADIQAQSDVIDEDGTIQMGQPRERRQLRTRPGTASKPYRSIDGTPLFERDAETGLINVIDAPDLQLDPKSLTPAARTVTFLYQFEKRNRREQNMFEPEDLEEMEEDGEEDYELEAQYAPPSATVNHEDAAASRAVEQLLEESELALVLATSLEDHTSDEFAALALQLRTLKQELEKHIYRPQEESTLDQILQTISHMDALVSGS